MFTSFLEKKGKKTFARFLLEKALAKETVCGQTWPKNCLRFLIPINMNTD